MNHASRTLAEDFAAHWIGAWNSHDIEAILSHYGEDVVFLSPVAAQRTGNGRVIGREALRSYWSAGLTAQPELQFELDKVLIGCWRRLNLDSECRFFLDRGLAANIWLVGC